jgi:hypothetical protein
LQRSVGCSFIIGQKLTKSAKPYLVYCFCGEFFAFQLTPRQAAQLEVQDGMLVSARGLRLQNHEPHPEPLVQLKNAEINNAEKLDSSSIIEGSLSFNSGQLWVMPMAIQVVCQPAGKNNMTLFHHLDHLPKGENSLRFTLPPLTDLRDRQGELFSGVVPLFIQIGIVGEPEANSTLPTFTTPKLPTLPKQFGMQPQIPVPGPPVQQRLGEHFIPPTPVPTLMTPDTMSFPPRLDLEPPSPTAPSTNRFRSVSDIRAVLVEIY